MLKLHAPTRSAGVLVAKGISSVTAVTKSELTLSAGPSDSVAMRLAVGAFWALVVLWLLFAFSYTKVGFEHKTNKPGNDQQSIATQEYVVGKPLPFKKVFTYSLGVMSLQKPDPKPITIAAQTLVIFQTILCPIQAALLALAIRRRFMR